MTEVCKKQPIKQSKSVECQPVQSCRRGILVHSTRMCIYAVIQQFCILKLCCFMQVQSKVLHRVLYSLQREHHCVLLKGVW